MGEEKQAMLGMEVHLPLVKDVPFLWTTASSFIFLPVPCLLFCSCRNDAYQLGKKRQNKQAKIRQKAAISTQNPRPPFCLLVITQGQKTPDHRHAGSGNGLNQGLQNNYQSKSCQEVL